MIGWPNLVDHDSDNLLSGLEKSLEVAASDIEGINMDAVHHRDKAGTLSGTMVRHRLIGILLPYCNSKQLNGKGYTFLSRFSSCAK
jgi:hypothetical protein